MNTWSSRIQEGMPVRAADGEKLGKITRLEGGQLVIEKGVFFKKEYLADESQIADIRDGEVWITRSREELSAYSLAGGAQRGTEETTTAASGVAGEERRIPLMEEELIAEKRMHEAGRVNIRKEVKTEEREVRIPVLKEEVHVERVPASQTSASAEGAKFQEESISVPIHEEEVEIRKRPVVREEVRVRTERGVGELRATEEVRKETAEVEEEGRGIRHESDPYKRE